jgi:hypothetical protein
VIACERCGHERECGEADQKAGHDVEQLMLFGENAGETDSKHPERHHEAKEGPTEYRPPKEGADSRMKRGEDVPGWITVVDELERTL